MKVAFLAHLSILYARDDVTGFDTGPFCWAIRIHLGHQHTLSIIDVKRLGETRCQALYH